LYVNSSAELLGGAERCLTWLVEGLGGRYEQVVALPRPGPLAAELAARGATVHTLEFGVPRSRRELATPRVAWRLANILPGALRLARLIARERIDVVHTNTSVPLAGGIAARLMRRPHVWHVREVLDRPPGLAPGLRRLIPRLADVVVCISAAVRAPFGTLPPALAARLVIVHDGFDVDFFTHAPLPPPEARPPLVGMVARITPFKGHALFLTMAAQVAARHPAARFVIAGGCPPAYRDLRRDLERQAAALGLSRRLAWTGQLERAALRELLGQVAVFVHPAVRPEPLGLVILEAMAAGCPVVATAHGGPLETVRPGVDGLLTPPGDADALAGAVGLLLADRGLRAGLGAAALTKVQAEYGLPTHWARIAAIYDRLAPRADA
jgi:glycosyltransferase involved in cell wall biosynthesis